MGQNFNINCRGCGKPGVETFDIEDGPENDIHCPRCNDRLIEQSKEQQEWNYYHPGGK